MDYFRSLCILTRCPAVQSGEISFCGAISVMCITPQNILYWRDCQFYIWIIDLNTLRSVRTQLHLDVIHSMLADIHGRVYIIDYDNRLHRITFEYDETNASYHSEIVEISIQIEDIPEGLLPEGSNRTFWNDDKWNIYMQSGAQVYRFEYQTNRFCRVPNFHRLDGNPTLRYFDGSECNPSILSCKSDGSRFLVYEADFSQTTAGDIDDDASVELSIVEWQHYPSRRKVLIRDGVYGTIGVQPQTNSIYMVREEYGGRNILYQYVYQVMSLTDRCIEVLTTHPHILEILPRLPEELRFRFPS